MYIAILGRQPAISLAELERVFSSVRRYSPVAALVDTESLDIQRLGGSQKAGRVVLTISGADWARASTQLIDHYVTAWKGREGKVTLGISAYGFSVSERDVQKAGIILKSRLKKAGVSMRLVPNQDVALSSATSHHNKLGLSENKVELLIVRGSDDIIIAESTGAQHITSLAARDQGRPKRDAFVGMLPPKLALIMVNLATGGKAPRPDHRILDPFCGTGVLLQESLLLGYPVYGTDLSEKMISYSEENLQWLKGAYHVTQDWKLHEGDAIKTTWQPPIEAVATEAYLGQPFSAPPSPAKLQEVRGNCTYIIGEFLKNLHPQLEPGTALCVAVPAWRGKDGLFTHLSIARETKSYGYDLLSFSTIKPGELLYYRENQVVARELLVLIRK